MNKAVVGEEPGVSKNLSSVILYTFLFRKIQQGEKMVHHIKLESG